jgi:hypothetical protein
MDSHRAPWTPAEAELLIEGVRCSLLDAPRRINWDTVWESVRHRLPGRTKWATRTRWHTWSTTSLSSEKLPEDSAGGYKAPWTQQEAAALRSAVEDARRAPGGIDWMFLERSLVRTSSLAGRTLDAIRNYWRTTLCTTPAALAMLREVEEVLAGGGRAAPAAAPHDAAALPTPFHMLHSLRSAGCIDEQALRVCWLAAAQALER